eukprot:1134635-Amphidinium_carterae.1
MKKLPGSSAEESIAATFGSSSSQTARHEEGFVSQHSHDSMCKLVTYEGLDWLQSGESANGNITYSAEGVCISSLLLLFIGTYRNLSEHRKTSHQESTEHVQFCSVHRAPKLHFASHTFYHLRHDTCWHKQPMHQKLKLVDKCRLFSLLGAQWRLGTAHGKSLLQGFESFGTGFLGPT